MFEKYVHKIIEYRIPLSGLLLIALGTFLTYIGQNVSDKLGEYQKNLSGNDETIRLLDADNSKLNVSVTKPLSDEQLGGQADALFGVPDVMAMEQHTDKQMETGMPAIPEEDLSGIILEAKGLCAEGRNDEAYRVVDSLRQKYPDYGPAYFILGTIEMYRDHYVKGEKLLNRAIQLGLSDEDMALANHNLSYSMHQKQEFEKANELLENAVEFNPDINNN